MKSYFKEHSLNYKVFPVLAFVLAVIFGILIERLCFSISNELVTDILDEYANLFDQNQIIKTELFRDLLYSQMKQLLLLFALGFTIAGLPVSFWSFFVQLLRDVFFLLAMYRGYGGNGYVLCFTAVVIRILFKLPMYLFCFSLSYRSFVSCIQNGARFFCLTNYSLPKYLKIGIIIVICSIVGVAVESSFCTYLLQRMFLK